MIPPVYLYDDPADAAHFLPFTQSRPIGELRHGAYLLRERVSRAFAPVEGYLAAAHLAAYTEPEAPKVVGPQGGQVLFLRSSFAIEPKTFAMSMPPSSKGGGVGLRLTDEFGVTIGALMQADAWRGADSIDYKWPAFELKGTLLKGAWEIVAKLKATLEADIEARREKQGPARVPGGTALLGNAADLMIDDSAMIEPQVVFDTRGGPIWIRKGAEVRSFSYLAGPLVIGDKARIVGGQVRESSIGPRCVVHGEVSNCVFTGYTNKSHDGFLGHSVIGRWVNLGAGTINSNLKNTYGAVRLQLGSERVETGLQFMGALIGDHVKTAIGTMIGTGSVIGTGANLFGSRRPEAVVAPFAWGTEEPGRVVACRMFLQTASKVLPRRDVAFDDATRKYFEQVWTHCTGQPCA